MPKKMQYEEVSRETERVWERMAFRRELIRSNDQIQWWMAHVFEPNLDASPQKTYHCAMSSEVIRYTHGECELYMCWLEYDGAPCIAVPVYVHLDVAFAQGIRRFHALCDVPRAAGRLGAHLLAEVCECFRKDPSHRLRYLFACPFTPFADQLCARLSEASVRFCFHNDSLLPYCGNEYMCPPESTWLRYRFNYAPVLSLVETDGTQKELGAFIREARNAWDVLGQQWLRRNATFDQRVLDEGLAPYNFLKDMSGGVGIAVINADSIADRLAYCARSAWERDNDPTDELYDIERRLNALRGRR